MSNFWLKVKVWTKLTLLFLILIYLLIFVAKNSDEPVKFWYWYNRQWDTSLLYFTFFTFLAGVVAATLARMVYKTVGQFREMRRRTEQERNERELAELRSKAAMLQQRPQPSAAPDRTSDPLPLADPPATERPSTDPPAAP